METTVFNDIQIDRIIEMAWEDRTPFEAITFQFGISEQETIELMRREMKLSSFKMWRKRVQGRTTKHAKLRSNGIDRFKCTLQRQITHNKIMEKLNKLKDIDLRESNFSKIRVPESSKNSNLLIYQ